MSWRSEGEREENQRPALIASRSSMVRMGSSMVCLLSDWRRRIVACGTGARSGLSPRHACAAAASRSAASAWPGRPRCRCRHWRWCRLRTKWSRSLRQLLLQRARRPPREQFLDAGQRVGRAGVEPLGQRQGLGAGAAPAASTRLTTPSACRRVGADALAAHQQLGWPAGAAGRAPGSSWRRRRATAPRCCRPSRTRRCRRRR